MHVGQKIKQLRKAHKLTQEELAKILDGSRTIPYHILIYQRLDVIIFSIVQNPCKIIFSA